MDNSKIITYDLRFPIRNYSNLYAYLDTFPCRLKITESTWYVKSPLSCARIRDDILKTLDSNDRVFVAELKISAAWNNLICDSDKLKHNLEN